MKFALDEEGTRRECAYLKGEYHDMKCFGLIRFWRRRTPVASCDDGSKRGQTPRERNRGKTPTDREPTRGGSPD